MTTRKLPLSSALLVSLASTLAAATAVAQTPAPAAPTVTPAVPAETPPPAAAPAPAPAPAPAEKKPRTAGPGLSLAPETPQVGGRVTSPAEPPPVVAPEPSAEWKFEVTGYFRAPMRFSWGPATTSPGVDPNTGDQLPPSLAGTQLRTPPMVPDANYIDWRYTNSFVGPWTELNFKYGNDRVKAQIQIASYNLTDPGYRRLESNLGINQAFLTLLWPELANNENLHLTLTVGGFTNRYGAAGRYDAGKYETYLFGRTHVAGATVNVAYDANDDLTFQIETGGGAKLEPIPYYGAPGPSSQPLTRLPAWEPYPGPAPQESAFVAHLHLGAVIKRQWIIGLHFIDVFANDNERSTSYAGDPPGTFGDACGSPMGTASPPMVCARAYTAPRPRIMTYGIDIKQLHQWIGDGYAGFSVVDARNAIYLGDAIEVIHSFGGWQLHDNYFGPPGGTDNVTGKIYSFLFQYSLSLGQLMWHPQAFWGQGPDLIITPFLMWNHVSIDTSAAGTNSSPLYNGVDKLKFGVEATYMGLDWLGAGFRFDSVQPNLNDSNQSFSVFSPRLIFRTAFVTHEQIMLQYSHYFAGSAVRSQFPYNMQPGGGGEQGIDKNAAQIAAIIWF